MNYKKIRNLICAALAGGAMLSGGTSEAGIVTDRFPIQMYAESQLNTYNNINQSQRAGYADGGTDLIKVYRYSNGWLQVQHPGAGNRLVTRWCKANELFADPNYSNRGVHINGSQTVYRTSNGNTQFGSVSNEDVIVLGERNNRQQILYLLNNGQGYKVGWINKSQPTPTPTPSGDANGDGRVDTNDLNLVKQKIFGNNVSIIVANVDFDGNGQITATDLSTLQQLINSGNNIPAKLQELINKWKDTTWKNHTYLAGVMECKEFASYIFDQMYGVGYIGSGSVSNNPQNYLINLANPSRVALVSYKTDLSATTAQQLFAAAKAGDFVQIRRRSGGPHSGIFVQRTNNGIVLFEANADGKNSIKTNSYSYGDLANKNYAMSLYRAK